jgi:hypothetical protein
MLGVFAPERPFDTGISWEGINDVILESRYSTREKNVTPPQLLFQHVFSNRLSVNKDFSLTMRSSLGVHKMIKCCYADIGQASQKNL